MTFHKVTNDATGNPIYELDMVEFDGEWYVVKKFKGDYILENDSRKIALGRVDSRELFLVEHFM